MDSDGGGTPACYLIVDEHTRPGNPAGVLRRVTAPDGEITSEKAFGRNLAWRDVTGHRPAQPRQRDRDLFEITSGEAVRVIATMHLSAARADGPAAAAPVTGGKPAVRDLGIDPDAQDWARSGDGPGSIEITFPLPPGEQAGEWERGDWVLMRVTADPARLILVFDRNEWACFLDGARKGEFDVGSR